MLGVGTQLMLLEAAEWLLNSISVKQRFTWDGCLHYTELLSETDLPVHCLWLGPRIFRERLC